MIVEIYISSYSYDESLPNGINLKISRCNSDEASICLEDDSGKPLCPSFEVNYEELKLGVDKLAYK